MVLGKGKEGKTNDKIHVFRRDTFTMYGAGSAYAKAKVMLVQSAAKQQAKRRVRQQLCPLLAVNDMPVVVS